MKRFIISISILILAIAVSVSAYYILDKRTDKLIEMISEVEAAAGNGKNPEKETEIFLAEWEKSEKLYHILVSRERMDNLEKEIYSLKPFLDTGQTESFVEACFNSKNMIKLIKESETLNIKNIL